MLFMIIYNEVAFTFIKLKYACNLAQDFILPSKMRFFQCCFHYCLGAKAALKRLFKYKVKIPGLRKTFLPDV